VEEKADHDVFCICPHYFLFLLFRVELWHLTTHFHAAVIGQHGSVLLGEWVKVCANRHKGMCTSCLVYHLFLFFLRTPTQQYPDHQSEKIRIRRQALFEYQKLYRLDVIHVFLAYTFLAQFGIRFSPRLMLFQDRLCETLAN
jgi:hypothetical protein